MSNKIQEFFNEKFGDVRVLTVNDVVYFIGFDIAKALGYSNCRKAIVTHCKKPIKVSIDVMSQNGTAHNKARKSQEMLCITKSDIYRLIVRSKLEIADEFETWIFDEILPIIENTGGYIESGREEEMVSKYFPSFSKEVQSQMVNDLIKQNSELKEFYDDLMNTEGLMSMNIVAKECNIGLKTLYSYLRNKSIMFYKDNINIPYQRFMNQGLFQVKETPCQDGMVRSVTYATKKGLDYIRKSLKKSGYLISASEL